MLIDSPTLRQATFDILTSHNYQPARNQTHTRYQVIDITLPTGERVPAALITQSKPDNRWIGRQPADYYGILSEVPYALITTVTRDARSIETYLIASHTLIGHFEEASTERQRHGLIIRPHSPLFICLDELPYHDPHYSPGSNVLAHASICGHLDITNTQPEPDPTHIVFQQIINRTRRELADLFGVPHTQLHIDVRVS